MDPRDGPTDDRRVTTAPDPALAVRRRSALPLTAEDLIPWLSAAFVMASLNLVAAVWGVQLTLEGWAVLLIGLVATIVAAGLVAARERQEQERAAAEERARPSGDVLGMGAHDGSGPGYVTGMSRWSAAMLELIEHAAEAAPPGHVQDSLLAASEDTRALCDLLHASEGHDIGLNDAAMLHAVCSLWETDQERVERLAAEVDPHWHRRWRARSITARRLRHGQVDADRLVLPYR